MGIAPRYAVALAIRSGIGVPENISLTPSARSLASIGITSSPSTTAMRSFTPSSSASFASARPQACGFTPPAFAITLMPFAAASLRTLFIATSTKSVA
ncbi:MAG: hypothetical protein H6R20_1824 [Proteobacteria bacterium]|nr:hypothetical protein [Pseudomonadota bacterium]